MVGGRLIEYMISEARKERLPAWLVYHWLYGPVLAVDHYEGAEQTREATLYFSFLEGTMYLISNSTCGDRFVFGCFNTHTLVL